ncbi:MAG: hypothetical protein JOZ81_03240 [Chloroflexi bacterium]|nr:hypothetical protein [Chloroflexota bacterium]
MNEVQEIVVRSAQAAGLHATAPALLLELQTQLGGLAHAATTATERGRRPFRPSKEWETRLGELAYGVYLLADQTGVDIAAQIGRTADWLQHRAQQVTPNGDWPFEPA